MYNNDTPLYKYRLSMDGHHSFIVLSPYASAEDLWKYLKSILGYDDSAMEKFVVVDKQLKISDILVRIRNICVIDRPYGNESIKLSDIHKKTKSVNDVVDKPVVRAMVGQIARGH